ncbi:hypothetical protein [Nonomuraea sediminis]|uniref:hypothetical protein n=1 Tax=Nonomuraea sediminis TaxID=2835864 RepID=UPI001BDDAD61|nr:hypothetical protein [Nonomuraea sediminis]
MLPTDKSEHTLQVNPLLARLLSHGVETCVFRGYVGPSENDGSIRLYPSLGRLNFSIEIRVADIVETAPAPKAALPHDGTVIWVRNDAEVVFHGDTVTVVPVRTLRGAATAVVDNAVVSGSGEAAKHVDIVRGRLRMSVPAAASVIRDDCDVCASCRGCASCTSVCQSGPA